MLPVFGSPGCMERSKPQVVFVVEAGMAVDRVLHSILKILLYFHLHVDSRFTWSWLLFNIDNVQLLAKIGPSRQILEFSPKTLASFKKALLSYNNQQTALESADSKLGNLATCLLAVLKDFIRPWSALNSFQSPSKISNKKFHTDIRNYVFLIAALPSLSIDHLSNYINLKNPARNNKPTDPSKNLSRTLDSFQRTLFSDIVVSQFHNLKTTLSWIDLSSTGNTNKVSQHIITSISCMLKSNVGGWVLPFYLLSDLTDLLYFPRVFQNYRPISIPIPNLSRFGKARSSNEVRFLQLSSIKSLRENCKCEVTLNVSGISVPFIFTHLKSKQTISSGNLFSQNCGDITCKSLINSNSIKEANFLGFCPIEDITFCFFDTQFVGVPADMKDISQTYFTIFDITANMKYVPLLKMEMSDDIGSAVVQRLLFILPYLPGTLLLSFVHNSFEGKAFESIFDGEISNDHALQVSNQPLDSFYNDEIDQDIRQFLFPTSGAKNEELPEFTLSYFCLGVWNFELEGNHFPKFIHHPNDIHTTLENSDDKNQERVEVEENDSLHKKIASSTLEEEFTALSSISSINQLSFSLKKYYFSTLYQKKMDLWAFVDSFFPSVVLTASLCEDGTAQEMFMKLLQYITNSLLLSVFAIKQKFSAITQEFEKSPASGELFSLSNPFCDDMEKRIFFDALICKYPASIVSDSGYFLNNSSELPEIKDTINSFLIKETQLQIILILECLTLAKEKKLDLPYIDLFHKSNVSTTPQEPTTTSLPTNKKRKSAMDFLGGDFSADANSNKKKRPSSKPKNEEGRVSTSLKNKEATQVFEEAAEFLLAELCVWLSIGGEDDIGNDYDDPDDYKGLIQKFLERLIIFHFLNFLPELVARLYSKIGGKIKDTPKKMWKSCSAKPAMPTNPPDSGTFSDFLTSECNSSLNGGRGKKKRIPASIAKRLPKSNILMNKKHGVKLRGEKTVPKVKSNLIPRANPIVLKKLKIQEAKKIANGCATSVISTNEKMLKDLQFGKAISHRSAPEEANNPFLTSHPTSKVEPKVVKQSKAIISKCSISTVDKKGVVLVSETPRVNKRVELDMEERILQSPIN